MSLGQIVGVVTEVSTNVTTIRADVDSDHEYLRWHNLPHRSIENCPPSLRKVGQRVALEYRSNAQYGLWFVTGAV